MYVSQYVHVGSYLRLHNDCTARDKLIVSVEHAPLPVDVINLSFDVFKWRRPRWVPQPNLKTSPATVQPPFPPFSDFRGPVPPPARPRGPPLGFPPCLPGPAGEITTLAPQGLHTEVR